MTDQVITKQELIDAQKDAQTLEDAVNGAPGKLIKSRTGREFYSLASVPQINTMTREEVAAAVAPKANKVDVDSELAIKADTSYVDSGLSLKANQSTTYTKSEVDTTFAAYVGGRKAYTTLALAVAAQATLTANTAVEVTNDPTASNNGAYQWNGTTLTKSAYDPLSQAKADATTKANAVKAYIDSNDASTNYDSATFNESKYYSNTGVATNSPLAASTALIPVKADDTVTVFTKVSTSSNPVILIYDALGVFVRSVFPSVASIPTETTTTITVDGFVRSQWMSGGTPLTDKDGVAKLVINEGLPIFLEPKELVNQPIITNKSDKVRSVKLLSTDFTRYNWTIQGILSTELEPKTVIGQTVAMKLSKGTKVKLSKMSATYSYAIRSGDTPAVTANTDQWISSSVSSREYTVSKEYEYVRVFIRSGNEILETNKQNIVENIFDISVESDIAYLNEVRLEISNVNNLLSNAASFDFNNSFRAPQLATGGVVSIIDDDGQIGVYNTLYPLLKSLDFPFGAAIVPSWVGDADRISFDQLVEMSNDFKYFEVMNHTWSHKNLTGLTNTQMHEEVYKTKQWFTANGFEANGLVLPFGGDNDEVQRVIQQYYNSCYDFGDGNGISTFDTIKNYTIKRSSFGIQSDRLTSHKSLVDTVAANNGWLVITTHVNHALYWDDNSAADLTELVNYIKSKGCKIMKPRDAFQVFGNIVENQNGFKITANGKIIGAS